MLLFQLRLHGVLTMPKSHRKPRLLEVCPFEWEAVVRRCGTDDPPRVMLLSRRLGVWFVWVDGLRDKLDPCTKTFANREEAFAYANEEYEDAR